MSRRTSLFEDVMNMPWPVGVVLAVVVFAIQHILLANLSQGMMGAVFIAAIVMIGYLFIALFLLASLFSLNQACHSDHTIWQYKLPCGNSRTYVAAI